MSDGLQFDRAEPVGGVGGMPSAAPRCAACAAPIVGSYFEAAGKMFCANCRAAIDAPPPGSVMGRLAKATAFGLGAGIAGAILWYGVQRLTGLTLGLIAIVVGYMVGAAVRRGGGGRGGIGYQLLAVAIAYLSICMALAPLALESLYKDSDKDKPTQAQLDKLSSTKPTSTLREQPEHGEGANAGLSGNQILFGVILYGFFFLALPVLVGIGHPISLLIYGFALWEAGKLNRRLRIPFTGPHVLGQGGMAPPLPPIPGRI